MGHNTSRHLQRLVHVLEDAKHSHRNLFVLYVDFTNAFNTISHDKLFRIMSDLGYPDDAIDTIRGIYTATSSRV